MKATFLIAASLIVSTAAIAQTTNPDPSASTTTDNVAPQTAPATPMAGSTMPAPAPAPAPTTDTSAMNATPAPTTADMSSYPPCSRSVQDHCVQTHEMKRKHR